MHVIITIMKISNLCIDIFMKEWHQNVSCLNSWLFIKHAFHGKHIMKARKTCVYIAMEHTCKNMLILFYNFISSHTYTHICLKHYYG